MENLKLIFLFVWFVLSSCVGNNDTLVIKHVHHGRTFMDMNRCDNFGLLVSKEEIATKAISEKEVIDFVYKRLNELSEQPEDLMAIEPEAYAKARLVFEADTFEFCFGLTDYLIIDGHVRKDTVLHRFMYELTWDEKY